MPAAAISSVTDSGSSRTPVSIADRPSATDRNSGTAKNSPPCTKYCAKNAVRPARSCELRRMPGSTSGCPPRASSRFSHFMKTQITTPPPRISQIVGDRPSHCGWSGLGTTKPQVPARSTPNTISPSPVAERAVPTRSRRDALLARYVVNLPAEGQDPDHDQHLAREHVAPRQVAREQAPDDRAHGDRDRRGRCDQPVGPRAFAAVEVGGHQRDDRRQDQHRAEPLQQRPPEQQHRRGSARWR